MKATHARQRLGDAFRVAYSSPEPPRGEQTTVRISINCYSSTRRTISLRVEHKQAYSGLHVPSQAPRQAAARNVLGPLSRREHAPTHQLAVLRDHGCTVKLTKSHRDHPSASARRTVTALVGARACDANRPAAGA